MEQHNRDDVQEQTESAKAEIRHPVMIRVLIALSLLLAFALFDVFAHPIPLPVILAEIWVTGYLTWHPEIILNSSLFDSNNWKGMNR